MELLELLSQYSQQNIYPMHMPGHKRNPAFLPISDPILLDITEIHGFDNLHAAEGVLKDAMERAACLWGAMSSHFLVNGSSAGILAALSAAVEEGGEVILDRSAHKSAYHGVELRGLVPHYVNRPIDPETGVLGSLTAREAERLFSLHPRARALFVTSPTYEGVVSDIGALARVAHSHGALLIVDEAHGAHLGFSPAFPRSAVREGADLVIQSLHKTLPAFTQSAILHICTDWVDREKVGKYLSYYQTTSPSYLLMAGMDTCVALLREHGAELFAAYEKRLANFHQQTAGLAHIRVLDGTSPVMWQHDPGKLYFSLGETDLSGEEFSRILREEFGIEPEMTTANGCLCMTSIADTDEGFSRLAEAVIAIDRRLRKGEHRSVALPDAPMQVYTPAEAARRKSRSVRVQDAAGAIAGEFIWAYPPDIPLLVPGERIDFALLDALLTLQKSGVRLHSDSECFPETVRVIEPTEE